MPRIFSLMVNADKSSSKQDNSQILGLWLQAPATADFWTGEALRRDTIQPKL
jgi:hypothetical protein